jgi:hypothetical protein
MSDILENSAEQSTTEATSATESAAPEATTETASPAATNEVNFLELISEDYRSKGNIGDFKSADDLAKSYLELQKMVGNSVRLPSEDTSDEAKQEFLNKIKDIDGVLIKGDEDLYNKLGRPEAPEGYDFSEVVKPEILESLPSIGTEIEEFQKMAHENGLTTQQAKSLVDMRLQAIDGEMQRQNEVREESERALRKQWGEDYDNRIDAANQVLKIYSEQDSEGVQELLNTPAANNPAFIRMLSELSHMYKEKGHEGLSKTNFGVTPEGAQSKISEKRGDTGFMKAYTDVHHPEHKKAVAELTKLYEIANGAS